MANLSTQNLKAYLKRQLKLKGLTYKDLAKKMKVSEITVKRWMTSRDLTAETLFKIQDILQVKAVDFSLNDKSPSDKKYFTPYTLEQEKHFASHPRDLLLFIKLHFTLSPRQAKSQLGYSDQEFLAALSRLEEIKALELWPGDKLRFTLKGPFSPAKNGPIISKIFSLVRDRIMDHFKKNFPALTSLAEQNEVSQFRAYEFYATEKTALEFSNELRNLVAKYYQVGTLEAQRKEEVHPYSVLIGVDKFDVLSAIAQRKDSDA